MMLRGLRARSRLVLVHRRPGAGGPWSVASARSPMCQWSVGRGGVGWSRLGRTPVTLCPVCDANVHSARQSAEHKSA
eukprot:scaffold2825_cov111-Isochrysis_galbana.AAC.11